MIELTKHIEYLLLENDCVIVPDLGGFIAHNQPAHYEESEGIFLPPLRTIGFNPQLTMNDGLLAQLYMQVYHTDFSDAVRKMAEAVENLKNTLYQDGAVEMPGIGVLHYTITDTYEFHPMENGILSPSLYGLDAFRMPLLGEKPEEEPVLVAEKEEPVVVALPAKERKEVRLHPNWWGNAVAVAVAAVLFFVLSVPVENTYVDKGNYASLGTDCLLDAIRSQSMATTLLVPETANPQARKAQDLKPVAVKVEKVAPAPKKEEVRPAVMEAPKETKAEKPAKPQPAPETKKVKETAKPAPAAPKAVPAPTTAKKKGNYHIIVASLPTASDAQRMLKEYQQQGYSGASVMQGGGRFRISLCSYSDKAEAYRKLNDLKKADAFKAAWMLTAK